MITLKNGRELDARLLSIYAHQEYKHHAENRTSRYVGKYSHFDYRLEERELIGIVTTTVGTQIPFSISIIYVQELDQ